jgi:MFS family permease
VTTQTITTEHTTFEDQPSTTAAFRKIKLLTAGYLAISVAAVGATVLMRNHAAEVNSSVLIHGIAVAASAVGAFFAARLAARGSRGAYLRLRILSVVVVVAIAAIIALPGTFPLWMKAEQGVAGLLMAGVAVLANSSQVRARFAK